MRELIAFTKKETWHILRDTKTMMIILLIPVILMILFGFAISTEINNVNIAVVIERNGEEVRQSVERLSNNPYFTFIGTIRQDEIDGVFRRDKADAVVVFDRDFNAQVVVDASNSNTATVASTYIQSILQGSQTSAFIPQTHLLFNPQMKSSYTFVPGIMGLIFILICAMMTSVSIVKEKETGTMEVLLVSPVKPINIMVAKMIPYFVLSCVNLATILLIARFILGVPMSGRLLPIVGISLLYLLLALSIGLFISTVTSHQIVALIISGMLMMMPCMLLSGMVFPVENMPKFLQWISCVIPARWYIDAIKKLMIEGVQFVAVMKDFLILLGMTVFNIVISRITFNDKLS